MMIVAIVLRQIPYMIYMLDIILANSTVISGKVYVLNSLYFLAETALILVLSQSIKWSLITNARYHEMLLLTVRDEANISLDQQDSQTSAHNLVYALCEDETFST